jgi:hypothetical protein
MLGEVGPNTRSMRFANTVITILIPPNTILNQKIALFDNVADYGSTQTQSMLTTVEFKKKCAVIDWN